MVKSIQEIKTEIYADGASIDEFLELNKYEHIKGFTTNPTLMRSNGIEDYRIFAKELLSKLKINLYRLRYLMTISSMKKQALEINSWAEKFS